MTAVQSIVVHNSNVQLPFIHMKVVQYSFHVHVWSDFFASDLYQSCIKILVLGIISILLQVGQRENECDIKGLNDHCHFRTLLTSWKEEFRILLSGRLKELPSMEIHFCIEDILKLDYIFVL